MVVRPASEHETDTIADVFLSSFRGLTFLPIIHSDDEIRTWIRTEMVASHEIWAADMRDEIVGFAALKDDLLGHLYVRPEWQSHGVGSALLETVKRERPGGFHFWVFQKNVRARCFYERHGCTLAELTDGTGNVEKEPDARYEWLP